MLLLKYQIFTDCAIDYYTSIDCFELKFLRTAQPKNSSSVGFRQWLIEILEAHSNSLYQKVGKNQGVHVIKDLISESVIEHFREIFEEHKFDKGFSMMKMLIKLTLG